MGRNKRDLFLNNKPLTLHSYSKSSSDDLVNRFGTGEQGETDLDMLKAQTQKSFAGGMFQRILMDPEKVSSISGGYYNEIDQKLYFALDKMGGEALDAFDEITAYCVHDDKIWIAGRANIAYPGQQFLNIIYVFYDNDQTWYKAGTLPTAIKNSGHKISTMIVHQDSIFISGKTRADNDSVAGFGVYRLGSTGGDGSGTTYTRVNTGLLKFLVSWRDTLYGLGTNGLWSFTKEFDSGTDQAVGKKIKGVGLYYKWNSPTNFMLEFNGAIWIGKMDGLFRYDGVDVVRVLDYTNNQLNENFKFACVWNGRLYYTIGLKLYRFDGSNIEMIADFSSVAYQIFGISAGVDRIYVTVRGQTTSASNDKWGAPMNETDVDVYAYSGFGFYKIYTSPCFFAQYGYAGFMIAGLHWAVFITNDGYLNASQEPRYNYAGGEYFDLDNEFSAIDRQEELEIISSEINNDFPSVDKMISGISIDAQGLNVLKEFTVQIRHEPDDITSQDEWTEWETVYQVKEGHFPFQGLTHNIHDGINDGTINIPSLAIRYKRLQFRLYASALGEDIEDPEDPESTIYVSGWDGVEKIVRFRSVTLRYTLQPRQRFAWSISANVQSFVEGLRETAFGDGSIDDRSAAEIRALIYNAMRSKAPLLFYDVEHFTVQSVDGDDIDLGVQYDILPGDVLAFSADGVENWENRKVDAVDGSTITLAPGGDRTAVGGGGLATPAQGDSVRISRLAYVTRIISEVIDPSDYTSTDQPNDGYDSLLSFELKEL